MSSYQKARDEFLGHMVAEGMSVETARLVLRDAATVQRWAEEECNGTIQRRDEDDKPERVCENPYTPTGYSRWAIRDTERQAMERIRRRLPAGFSVVFQGDPRGACVRVIVPSGEGDTWSGYLRCENGHIREHYNGAGAMTGCHVCGSRSEQVRAVCVPTRA